MIDEPSVFEVLRFDCILFPNIRSNFELMSILAFGSNPASGVTEGLAAKISIQMPPPTTDVYRKLP